MQKLGFGCMRLPQLDENDAKSIDFDTLLPMVDRFIERGFTYFDTAYMYHSEVSENAVRRAVVERYDREDFVLADKLPIMFLKEAEDHERFFETQLARTGAGYIDNYLLHNITVEKYELVQRLGSFDFIAAKKAEGKVRRIGFSFHDGAELLEQVLTEHPEVVFVQLQINYLDWENPSIQIRLCYETARQHGKPIVVMEPLKGGTLASLPTEAEAVLRALHPDWSIASWGLRFAAGLPGVEVVLSGMSTHAQLDDNTGFMQNPAKLGEEELAALETVRGILKSSRAIPCTACQYCVDGCPQKIAIPRYFAQYNEDIGSTQEWSLPRGYYETYTQVYGKASDCIACGLCEKACPQMLPVIRHLQQVAEHFEK